MSDPRRHLANPRVAHASLAGQVTADHFSDGTWQRVITPVANVHRDPLNPALERQLLMGEPFLVLEEIKDHAFGMCGLNGYVGYVPRAHLAELPETSHVVSVSRTLLFDRPDLKAPAPVPLSLGTQVLVVGEENRFAEIDTGGFVPVAHIRPSAASEPDPVSVAERLLGTPYLWGGNSAFGIDCSGLVQIAMNACGFYCPGDSDQQLSELGEPMASVSSVERGDLLFWKGHVAWARDTTTLIHANAGAMAVAIEDRATAIKRISDQGDGPLLAHLKPSKTPLAHRAPIGS
ncbi:MAG: NlpC/P60 family protein [Arenibacterium sp.]